MTGKKYSEIVFTILSPDPATKKDVHFLKYPIYVGGNQTREDITHKTRNLLGAVDN